MSNSPDRRKTDGAAGHRYRNQLRPRVYYSQFSFGMKKDNQTFRIGCGLVFVAIGVWLLLSIFDVIEIDSRYIWATFAVVLVALGLRLLLTKRK